MKNSKKIAKFAVGTALAELIASLMVNLPKYITTCYRFCIDSDAGYMWVINITIALVAAFVVSAVLKKGKLGITISIITFFMTVLVLEFALWHRNEFQSIFASNVTTDKIIGMIIGLVSGTIVLAILSRGDSTE